MHRLNELAEFVLPWLLEASFQIALLVLIVAATCSLARRAAARWRHALWLLVLLKVFLPPSLGTPVSIGRGAIGPWLRAKYLISDIHVTLHNNPVNVGGSDLDQHHVDLESDVPRELFHPPVLPAALLLAWLAGCVAFSALVAGRYWSVRRIVRASRVLDEGPARIALERIALELHLRRQPELRASQNVATPFLFGVIRPRIVLPDQLISAGDETALESVLTHELAHYKRYDAWIGWLQVAVQSLFWFHPFVWWANRSLRHERECACDAVVLQLGRLTPDCYGEAILNLLAASRGRSLVAGSLVGVFEPGGKLEQRLVEVANFRQLGRGRAWTYRLALVAFAVLFLPMDLGRQVIEAYPTEYLAAPGFPRLSEYPQIVKTNPDRGGTGVDPTLSEISVTFDRDMSKGMSWTGGPPLFPPVDKSRHARWTDARTCVLPVKLEKGTYYRVGINSSDYGNFESPAGVPAHPSVIAFVTKGADEATKQRLRIPKIVSLVPENGATDVDPATKSLAVTFDMPMGEGMTWLGGGGKMPKTPKGTAASWSKDGKTCTLPVELEPDHDYAMALNAGGRWNNFQSKWGIPLEHVGYEFHTRGRGNSAIGPED